MQNEQTEDQDSNSTQLAQVDRAGQLARRDFSGSSLAIGSSQTDAMVAKERAGVEARWIMAMRQPRNLDNVRQMILKECRRPGFADAAVYSVPRGEGKIEGLSIRFAEVAVRCMGNLQPDVVTIYDDAHVRHVRCTVTDFESNVTWSKDLTIKKSVERKFLKKGQPSLGERINSYGDRVYIVEATDDDVNTKEAAQVSKALRTLILRCVPGHIQDEALALCNQVYADKAAKNPDAARVAMLDAFSSQGVMPSDLEQFLGHSTEQMNPAELERLRKIYAAISQGETTWSEALENGRAPSKPAGTTSAPAAPQTAPATNTAQGPAATTAPAQASARSSKPKGTAGLKSTLAADTKPAEEPPTAFEKAAGDARARDIARKLEEQAAAPAPVGGSPEDEPGWMAGETRGATPNGGEPVDHSKNGTVDARGIPWRELNPEIPPDEPAAPEGCENRACARCRAWIQPPANAPAGQKCYGCQQA